MTKHFPIKFTLENGTHVVVTQIGTDTYHFRLEPHEGAPSDFTYVHEDNPERDVEEGLNFDQVDALRRFWLESEDIV